MFANNEIGRELRVDELQPGTVIVYQTGKGRLITVWVEQVGKGFLATYAGELKTTVLNTVRDGKIYDDLGNQIHVYEYLGEI